MKKRCNRCKKKTIHTYNNKPLCKLCQALLKKNVAENVTDFKQKKQKILFYDIETTPLKAWLWRLGEQVVRPHQLDEEFNNYGIICIAYKWEDKPTKVLGWGYKEQDTAKLIEQFDKIAETADVVIGKNSDRFDVKHLNTQRLIAGLPGLPGWLTNTDDVEKQFRRNFALPSYGLDYLSKCLLGRSGKDKMEFDDWIDIVEKKSLSSYKKMLTYCKHDVDDTAALWKLASKHFTPKFNMATFNRDTCCRFCGSTNIIKYGTRVRGKTTYQRFYCNDHGGSAGEAPINLNRGTFGKIA